MNCVCGHSYEDHTFSADRIGCDNCKCRVNILVALTYRLDNATEQVNALKVRAVELETQLQRALAEVAHLEEAYQNDA
jgi:hypothetical protein